MSWPKQKYDRLLRILQDVKTQIIFNNNEKAINRPVKNISISTDDAEILMEVIKDLANELSN